MTTFEGTMDARAATEDSDGRVTASLAWTASARAFGSSVAVALVPVAIAVSTLQAVGAVSAALLAAAGMLAMAGTLVGASLSGVSRRRRKTAAAVPEPIASGQPSVLRIATFPAVQENQSEWLAPVVPLRAESRILEPISPELVLVDPELRRRILEQPPELIPLLRPEAPDGRSRQRAAGFRPATQPA